METSDDESLNWKSHTQPLNDLPSDVHDQPQNSNTHSKGNLSGPFALSIPSGAIRKVIYFCRHAEALHNVKEREAVAKAMAAGCTAAEELTKARKAVLEQDNGLRDAPLSDEGAVQARKSGLALKSLFSEPTDTATPAALSASPSKTPFQRPDVVLVSPLRRALETATQLFYSDDHHTQPPLFFAIEALREKRTGLACDERSTVPELQIEFPHVDFTHVRDAEPIPLGENNSAVRERVASFLQQVLPKVSGQYLAIVSHKGWLRELRAVLKKHVDTGNLSADFDLGGDWHTTLYGNAEVRVASLTWLDGELVKLTSRSIAAAQIIAQAAMLGDGFEFANKPSSGFSIFLADRTTKVHFISLPQGKHHVAIRDAADFELDPEALLIRPKGTRVEDHPLFDARLTSKGQKQAQKLRQMLAKRPSGGRPFTAFDLVLVSPLTRACETANIIFGESPGTFGGQKIPPPHIVVWEELRERYGRYVCDARRTKSELAAEFPTYDFSELEEEQDCCWTDHREAATHVRQRALDLLEGLAGTPYRCIAVVTHAEFLRHLFGALTQDQTWHPDDQMALWKEQRSSHCELRSVVLCAHGPVASRRSGSSIPSSTIRVPSSSSFSSLTSLPAMHPLGGSDNGEWKGEKCLIS